MQTKRKSLRIISTIIGLGISVLTVVARQIFPDWQIGYHKTEAEQPAQWYPATIPGAVQLDIMKAENYNQPWWYADNIKQFNWMEDIWFTYKTAFERPELKNGEHLFFFSKGIDYQFKIILNGKKVWEQEGMFSYVSVDLTDALRDRNELCVVLYPVPKLGFEDLTDNPDMYRKNARESVKPAVSYRWDWHPRCVTRGIWDETCLMICPASRLSDVSLAYTLNADLSQAVIQIHVEGVQLTGHTYTWTLKDPQGKTVLEKQGECTSDTFSFAAELSHPALWWPNGYGVPNLYAGEFCLVDKGRMIERQMARTGFRKIRMLMNEGAWEREGFFPKSRAVSPASLEVNNRRIFAKGSNWVHPEVFVSLLTPERYREQIVLAKNAHFNLFRVWGGGIVNKESFFDICDEMGILVWQEFPLACNNYTDDVYYLRVLEREACSIIRRVKKHACLALWSGGNELFNSWSGMTEQSLPLRLLNSLCYQLDPQTPFIYTSPLYGIGHGHYLFYDKSVNEEVFQWMARADKTAYTEFGIPSAANVNVLKSFIPKDELFPPKPNTDWAIHHGWGVWQKESWLEISTFEKYFGAPSSLEELVKYSQLLQCEGLKFIFEEARRQKPYCSMALSWCYQEPWPSAANNSLINWPNIVKPAYNHVANACRPVLVSVRIPKFEWSADEDFTCDLFLLNDTYQQIEPVSVTVVLQYDGKEDLILRWDCPNTEPFRNVLGPTIHFRLPQMKSNLFTIRVKADGRPEYNSVYKLLYKGDQINKAYPSDEYFMGK
jgi:beta-mannosidase